VAPSASGRRRTAALTACLTVVVLALAACAALPTGDPGPDPAGDLAAARPTDTHSYASAAGPYVTLTPWRPPGAPPRPTGRTTAPPRTSPAWAPAPERLPATPIPCPTGDRPKGWVAAENQRTGGAALRVPATAPGSGVVLGHADHSIVTCGGSVDVRMAGPPHLVRLAAFRVGWYGGGGSRRVWESRPVRVGPRPGARLSGGAGRPARPEWPSTVTVPIDGGWPPGFYLLAPMGPGGPVGPVIPLVVRDRSPSPPSLLFMASTLTWNAYGEWGGRSLYQGPGRGHTAVVANRARVVALHRPLVGSGYRQLVTMDLPAVRLLERVALGAAVDLGPARSPDGRRERRLPGREQPVVARPAGG
jgi:hypothetical protein